MLHPRATTEDLMTEDRMVIVEEAAGDPPA
jgi:hypothetical protein